MGLLTISADSDHLSNQSKNRTMDELITRKNLFHQHLKIFIIIGCLSVGVMVIIVSTYIGVKYCTMKKKHLHLRIPEQTQPLTKRSARQR